MSDSTIDCDTCNGRGTVGFFFFKGVCPSCCGTGINPRFRMPAPTPAPPPKRPAMGDLAYQIRADKQARLNRIEAEEFARERGRLRARSIKPEEFRAGTSDPTQMKDAELATELDRVAEIMREGWPTSAIEVAEAARRLRERDRALASAMVVKNGEILIMREERDAARAERERLKKALAEMVALWEANNDAEARCGCVGGSPDCPHPPPCEYCVAKELLADASLAPQPAEQPLEDSQPIGKCPRCGTPVYTEEGFCGVCKGGA